MTLHNNYGKLNGSTDAISFGSFLRIDVILVRYLGANLQIVSASSFEFSNNFPFCYYHYTRLPSTVISKEAKWRAGRVPNQVDSLGN